MRSTTPSLLIAMGVVLVTAAVATAQQTELPPTGEMRLPRGWTAADMQTVIAAATPGKMHEHLAKDAGTWECNTTMWMTPDSEPVKSGGELKLTSIMDGRYIQQELSGEIPGMGPFLGLGLCGYDNVAKKFVATWLDNVGTGIMAGEGELSADGKTLSWKFKTNCPITKKPIVMREVETTTGPHTKMLEMFGPDPKTGKEFKTMEIKLTRK